MNMTPLLAMRQATGYSLREVATALGCSHQAVSSFENGRTELSADLVKKYAKLVGVTEETMRRLQLRSKVMFHKREAARAEAALKAAPARGRKHSAVA